MVWIRLGDTKRLYLAGSTARPSRINRPPMGAIGQSTSGVSPLDRALAQVSRTDQHNVVLRCHRGSLPVRCVCKV